MVMKEVSKAQHAEAVVRKSREFRRLERAKKKLEQTNIKAGATGVVFYQELWKGSGDSMEPLKIGDLRRQGNDLCKIADAENLRVRIYINETDVLFLKEGMEATVELSAYPDSAFKGELVKIGRFGDDKNRRLGNLAMARQGESTVRVVDALVELKEFDERIRLGLSAKVTVQLEKRKAVLAVDVSAVGIDENGAYCRREDGSRVDVTIGRSTHEWVEIKTGLQKGDGVILNVYDKTSRN